MAMDISDVFNIQKKIKKAEEAPTKVLKQRVYGVLARVSSDRQALEGESIEMQQELAEALAQEKGGVIYGFYKEEGLSASKKRIHEREEVQRLMQDIKDGKINCVIAYKRDRMFRNAQENMEFLQFLVKHDCELFLTARGEMQVDLKNLQGMGQIMEYILATFAQMESATTSARVSDTMISIALKGERTGGMLPIGYMYGEDEKIVPIPGAQALIEQIEDMYLAGLGKGSIATWLNGGEVNGYETLTYPVPKPRVQKLKNATDAWNTSNIDTILFNPIYTGHTSYTSKKSEEIGRIIVPSDKIVAIRSLERQKEINDLAFKKRASKKPPRAYNTPFLLTGLLICEECGTPYKTTTSQKKEGVRNSYYKCGNKHSNTKGGTKPCSKSKTYRKEVIEAIILDTIKGTLQEFLNSDSYEIFNKKFEKNKAVESSELDNLDQKIKEKQEEFDNITNLVTHIKDTKVQLQYINTQSEILNMLNEMKETRSMLAEKLEIEIEESYDFDKFMKLAKEFGHIIEYSSVGTKKLLIEGFLNQITVNRNGDIKLELGIGIAKKVQDTIISLETMREPIVSKDIIVSSDDEWGYITVNYENFLKRMYNKVEQALFPFLQYKEPRFVYENFDLIDDSTLPNYKQPIQTSQIRYKKVNMFIEQTLGVAKYGRERLITNHVPEVKKLIDYLSKVGSNVDEFCDYIDKRYSGFVDGGEVVLEEIIKSYKGKAVEGKYLFEKIIKCGCCGEVYKGRKSSKSVRYVCKDNRADVKGERCNSSSIRENELIEQIQKDLGYEEIRRQDIVWKVESIVADKDGNYKINYKNM